MQDNLRPETGAELQLSILAIRFETRNLDMIDSAGLVHLIPRVKFVRRAFGRRKERVSVSSPNTTLVCFFLHKLAHNVW